MYKAKFTLWFKRVGWLILIWSASVAGLAALAILLRSVMNLAGMNTA